MDVGGLRTGAIEIHLSYDPLLLQIMDSDPGTPQIQPFAGGAFYQGVELRNREEGGLLAYSVGLLGETHQFATGQGIVASLQFRALQIGETDVRFNVTPQDWQDGHYTFFTLNDGSPKSFRDVFHAKLTISEAAGLRLRPIEDITIFEDDSTTISLEDYLTVDPLMAANVNWTYESIGEIHVALDAVTHVLTLTPPGNWTGQQEILVVASTPDGSVADVRFTMEVLPDPSDPVMQAFPQLQILEDKSQTVSLDAYVTDLDTPLDLLKWDVLEAGELNVEVDNVTRELTISSQPGQFGTNIIRLHVEDPEGNYDEGIVEIQILPSEGDTFTVEPFETIEMVSETPHLVDLAAHVHSNSIDASEIEWTISDNPDAFMIDMSVHGSVKITPPVGWTGASHIQLTATAPGGDSEQVSLSIIVSPGLLERYPLVCAVLRNPVISDYLHILVNTRAEAEPGNITGAASLGESSITLGFRRVQPRLWLAQMEMQPATTGKLTIALQAYDGSGNQIGELEQIYVLQ